MKSFLMIFFLLLPLSTFAQPITASAISVSEVTYDGGDIKLKGYLAKPAKLEGKAPGVLVVHEWWGHNAYARKRADMLAELGYIALAVDMYGDGKTAEHPDMAKEFASHISSTHGLMERRFGSAHQFLLKQDGVNTEKIAAIGYCFGGGTVLEMARRGLALKGVVSFHGSLGTKEPADEDVIQAEILAFNGAADPFVSEEQIASFKNEMEAANVKYQFINYPNVKHSFTNPQADEFAKKFELPLEYNAEADKDSWEKMKAFLGRVLG